jgi:hypothetical protein
MRPSLILFLLAACSKDGNRKRDGTDSTDTGVDTSQTALPSEGAPLLLTRTSASGGSVYAIDDTDIVHLEVELCAGKPLTVLALTPLIAGDLDGDGSNGIAGDIDVASRYDGCGATFVADGSQAAEVLPVYAPDHLELNLQPPIEFLPHDCVTLSIRCKRSNLPVEAPGEAYAIRFDEEGQVSAEFENGNALAPKDIFLGEVLAETREEPNVNTTPDTWVTFTP